MARAVSAMLILGFLLVAAFCMTEASADDSKGSLLDLKVKLKLSVDNKCNNDLRLLVAAGNILDCKKGNLAVLGPVEVKLVALNLLKVKIFVFDKNGKLLNIKVLININLSLLGKIVGDVTELLLVAVEEILEGVKVIKLLCGPVVVATIKL